MRILILIILCIFIYSYIKFRRKYKYFTTMVALLQEQTKKNYYNESLQLRLSSALINVQHYKDAYYIYQSLINKGTLLDVDKIRTNMAFCQNPIPTISEPKNLSGSYWHNFILVRFGKARYNFLMEEDFINTNNVLNSK